MILTDQTLYFLNFLAEKVIHEDLVQFKIFVKIVDFPCMILWVQIVLIPLTRILFMEFLNLIILHIIYCIQYYKILKLNQKAQLFKRKSYNSF